MRTLAFLALAAVLATAARADEQLVPAQSAISFTSKQMGVPVDGQFRKFGAQVAFDPKHPETARIALTVELASVSIGSPESEAELAKPGWFDSHRIAQATFQSTAVKATGARQYAVSGKLSIKGTPRDVVVPVTLSPAGALTVATGGFVLKRTDFKIGEGEWADTSMVADDVQVKFKLALSGMPAP